MFRIFCFSLCLLLQQVSADELDQDCSTACRRMNDEYSEDVTDETPPFIAPWGYHLILDCHACDVGAVTDPVNIEAFVKTLVDAIDMKAYGEPQIVHFGSDGATGYSLVQLIETSCITGHFVDENGDAYIDVFSCKEFSEETVLEVVEQFFSPEYVSARFMLRQA